MKLCTVEGCGRKIIARNLCAKHYQKAKYHGELPAYGRTGRTVVPTTHPLYIVWGSMKTRCTNKNSLSYGRYGALGISYDSRWEDFNNFYADMHEGYVPGLWLDRKDNSLGYSKENCRWVTPEESNRNREFCKLTEDRAEELRKLYNTGQYTQQQLAEHFHIDQTTVSDVVRFKAWK